MIKPIQEANLPNEVVVSLSKIILVAKGLLS